MSDKKLDDMNMALRAASEAFEALEQAVARMKLIILEQVAEALANALKIDPNPFSSCTIFTDWHAEPKPMHMREFAATIHPVPKIYSIRPKRSFNPHMTKRLPYMMRRFN